MAYNPKTWTEGTVVKPARVVIDGVEHEVLPEERTGATPITVDDMNKIEATFETFGKVQDNIENAIGETETSLKNKIGVRKKSLPAKSTITITGSIRATYLISTTSNSGVIKSCWLLLTGNDYGVAVNLADGTGGSISVSSNGAEISITNNGNYASNCYITTIADDTMDLKME